MTHEVVQELTKHDNPYFLDRLCFETIQVSGDFSPKPEVRISQGDTVLALHIGDYSNPHEPLKTGLHKDLRRITKLMSKVRKDMAQTHVVMLTNARLARVMGLIGFNTFEIDMPEEYKERVREGHRNSTSVLSTYDLEDPRFLMCYLPGKDFVVKFGKSPKGIY